MSSRIKLILISLWLFISFPFNLVLLKHLIRDVYWLAAHANAGLERYRPLHYLLVGIFVLVVIILLLRKSKLGRTLSIVLLVGSCCEMVAFALIGIPFAMEGTPNWPTLSGFALISVVLVINILCLRSLCGANSVVRSLK